MSETEQLKPESWLWHLLGLINPMIVMASNIVGGYWVASGVIYMLGLGPILDGKAETCSGIRSSLRSPAVYSRIHSVCNTRDTLVSCIHRWLSLDHMGCRTEYGYQFWSLWNHRRSRTWAYPQGFVFMVGWTSKFAQCPVSSLYDRAQFHAPQARLYGERSRDGALW